MKLSRLYQPKNPQFWLLVLLNLLSSAISWILQQQTMPFMGTALLSVFVLANITLGLKIAVQLINSDNHLPSRQR